MTKINEGNHVLYALSEYMTKPSELRPAIIQKVHSDEKQTVNLLVFLEDGDLNTNNFPDGRIILTEFEDDDINKPIHVWHGKVIENNDGIFLYISDVPFDANSLANTWNLRD